MLRRFRPDTIVQAETILRKPSGAQQLETRLEILPRKQTDSLSHHHRLDLKDKVGYQTTPHECSIRLSAVGDETCAEALRCTERHRRSWRPRDAVVRCVGSGGSFPGDNHNKRITNPEKIAAPLHDLVRPPTNNHVPCAPDCRAKSLPLCSRHKTRVVVGPSDQTIRGHRHIQEHLHSSQYRSVVTSRSTMPLDGENE